MGFTTIEHNVDFCVVGGGLAGMCAAIAAARGGSKVALMQDRPVLGGNASSEIRMWVCGCGDGDCKETGIIEEITLASFYRNPDKIYAIWDGLLFEKVKMEPNITLLLNCSACQCEMDGSRIVSVTGWQTTTQRWQKVNASRFADCSGDSVLAPLTGASFRVGREARDEFGEKTSQETADRQTMGMSCLIQMRKSERITKFIPPEWAVKMTPEVIKYRKPNMAESTENFWYLELGGNRDSIGDTEEVRDELLALAYGMVDYIKNSGEVDDGDHWCLDFLGFLPGKRESRRMMGPYIMTQGDVLSGGKFADVVAYGGWPLDDHHPDGFYHLGNPNVWGDTPKPYGIPYRCLYSANIDNLFFAGRNISMTHAAMSSSRVMATCALLGEAVGCAANIAREYNLTPQGVHDEQIRLLQERLMENGCFLPGMSRTVSDTAKTASLTAEGGENIENLRNGRDRNNHTYGDTENGADLVPGKAAEYTFAKPTELTNIHLAFDSDLHRKTLPGDWCERGHTMRANVVPESPTMHVPKTLVKSYRIEAVTEQGENICIAEENLNLLQCVNHSVSGKFCSVQFIPLTTWNDEPTEKIHIFSFDVR
ncbi:MAG: FAD-dependent oxidoreductase [Ruminococcaceae bacterium]|nr:FAD-dependent oxidoreductase [Oscillospiraceae bacterium]